MDVCRDGGQTWRMVRSHNEGRSAVIILGQPGGDPLQHPCMAQVQAVQVHEFAVGQVSHCRFETLGPTIFLMPGRNQPVSEDSLNQFKSTGSSAYNKW